MCVDPLLFHICTESYWGGVRGGVCGGGRGVGVMHALGQNRCRKEKSEKYFKGFTSELILWSLHV